MADKFIEELKKRFPGHSDNISAVSIGTLYMLYKKKNTTEDPEKKTIYSSIYDKELETIRSAFGFDTNPEVFEADKIAQMRMDEEAKEKEKEKTKQNVA